MSQTVRELGDPKFRKTNQNALKDKGPEPMVSAYETQAFWHGCSPAGSMYCCTEGFSGFILSLGMFL